MQRSPQACDAQAQEDAIEKKEARNFHMFFIHWCGVVSFFCLGWSCEVRNHDEPMNHAYVASSKIIESTG